MTGHKQFVEFSQSVRPALDRFVRLMELKLWENQHKGNRENWLRSHRDDLLEHLREELEELADEMEMPESNAKISRVAREAADVANMAMMLADHFMQDNPLAFKDE